MQDLQIMAIFLFSVSFAKQRMFLFCFMESELYDFLLFVSLFVHKQRKKQREKMSSALRLSRAVTLKHFEVTDKLFYVSFRAA